MIGTDFAMYDTDSLPGGIPLDSIEVLIERVTQAGLDNVTATALLQLKEKAEAIMANAIYAVKRKNIPLQGYANIYNVRYTAQTCRMASDELLIGSQE